MNACHQLSYKECLLFLIGPREKGMKISDVIQSGKNNLHFQYFCILAFLSQIYNWKLTLR